MTNTLVSQSKIKLSDIWDWADKNLKQGTGRYCSKDEQRYCALGAICFYLSNGKHSSPRSLKLNSPKEYSEYKKLFKLIDLGEVPWVLMNDFFHIKFKTMAKIARRFNL